MGLVQSVELPRSQNAVHELCTTGRMLVDETVTHGGRTKPNGTVNGKISFQNSVGKLYTSQSMAKYIELI